MKPFTAFFDTPPLFEKPLPVGQLYFPQWDRYEAAMRGIFERQYYTNNGPLLQDFEARLRNFFGVKHTICVGNATFGLMMVAEALGLTGRVLMPSFTFISSAQSLAWCGLTPVFCDVDPKTHQLDPSNVAQMLAVEKDISAIMAVNLWGGASDVMALQEIADFHDVPLYFDSAHAFGCHINDKPIGGFGDAEVFSFHSTKVLSATEGGCVTTNDDALAAKLRGIRPSYGHEKSTDPLRVLNSRMSEAQAAIGLMSLEDYPKIVTRNRMLFEAYEVILKTVPGITLVRPSNVTVSNYQYAVCEVDEDKFGLSRDNLLALLQAENILARRYFYPAIHHCIGFEDREAELPVTNAICARCLQLPLGAKVDSEDIAMICDLVSQAHAQAAQLKPLFDRRT